MNPRLSLVLASVFLFLGAGLFGEDIHIATQDQTTAGTETARRIMAEAYRRLGFRMVVENRPLERSIQEANQGVVDGDLYRQDGITASYPNLRKVPVVLTSGEMVVFTKTARFEVHGWSSLVPYSVGYLRGQKSVEQFLVPGSDAPSFSSLDQAFKVLEAQRIDGVVTTVLAGLVALKGLGYTDIGYLSPPLQAVPVYHYLNVKREALVEPLAKVLRQMDKEGLLAQIRRDVVNELLPGSN